MTEADPVLLEIALAGDMIVADDAAEFELPEVECGLVAAAGEAQCLPRRTPRTIAMEMILRGMPASASEAFARHVEYTDTVRSFAEGARAVVEKCSLMWVDR